jgi:hypothetical protein
MRVWSLLHFTLLLGSLSHEAEAVTWLRLTAESHRVLHCNLLLRLESLSFSTLEAEAATFQARFLFLFVTAGA